jgi:hypothetical protein
MNSDVIRQLVGRRPFEPFTMHLSGGEVYEVRHPETVAIGKQRVVVVDPDSDQMAICALLHVTSVETLQGA